MSITATCRTECAFDNTRFETLLKRENIPFTFAEEPDVGIFTLKVSDIEQVRSRLKHVIDTELEFVDLHRCYETLQEGNEPNENWFSQ